VGSERHAGNLAATYLGSYNMSYERSGQPVSGRGVWRLVNAEEVAVLLAFKEVNGNEVAKGFTLLIRRNLSGPVLVFLRGAEVVRFERQ
jgi:hypothetical protein